MRGIWILLGVFLVGCVEQIDLDIPRTSGQLVIFGNINTTDLPQQVEILRTTSIANRRDPVMGAKVLVRDQDGFEACFLEQGNGIYQFQVGSLPIEPGRSYYLEITLDDGAVYQSTPSTVPMVSASTTTRPNFTEVTSLSTQLIEVQDPVIQVVGSTEVNRQNEEFYLRWSVEEAWILLLTDFPDPFNNVPPPCYVTQDPDPQRLPLFDGFDQQSNSLGERIFAQKGIDYTFLTKHFFTTITHSISREAFDFWTQVDAVTNSTGSIFDIPPAAVQGNLFNVSNPDEEVLGYFEVSNATFDRFRVFKSEVPFDVPASGCDFDFRRTRSQYADFCLDCSFFAGGSFARPPFFDD